MKTKNILLGAAALAIGSSAFAQTEITLTGATAFRNASTQAIANAFNVVGAPGVTWNAAHDLANFTASNRQIFVGSFPGIPGTTIIRTSWSGSTEGLRAVALGDVNPAFRPTFMLPASVTSGINQVASPPTEAAHPLFSFSDVLQSTSPVASPQLNPANAAVGVVTFTMVSNVGTPGNWNNVTMQQYKALLQTGFQPLSLFTGDAADTKLVFAVGRNDGSGTRSAYLTELGYGVANPVQQYVATTAGVATPGVVSAITRVPAGGTGPGLLATSGGASNASTLWGNDIDGNGGYSSSSALRDHLQRTTSSVTIFDPESGQTPVLENQDILLLSWLTTADARTVAQNGGKLLDFNGVGVTPIATGFGPEDKAKIVNGQYSVWSYQQLYFRGTLNTNEQSFYDQLLAQLPAALNATANGIPIPEMNVSRPDDGAPIVAD